MAFRDIPILQPDADASPATGDVAPGSSRSVDVDRIRAQIREIEPLRDDTIDPRRQFHLDTTKVAFHRERVEALARGERVAPITIDMALTQKCSFACTYCYAGLQYNPESPVEWPVYEEFLDDVVSIGHRPGEGVKAISLVSDGESTENPHFYDFIRKGRENGLDLACGTNGLKLDRDRLPEIVESLTYLRFNISAGERDAYNEVMGVRGDIFDRVLENIRECVRLKRETGSAVTIGLQMVLLPQYADQVIPLALLGRDLGVDYTVIKHCTDDENGRLGVDYNWYRSELALDLLRAAEALSTETHSVQAKWSKLLTGRDRTYSKCFGTPLLLQTSGTCLVAPCGSFFNTDYERFHIGNFARTPFRELWASDRYWEIVGFLGSDRFDPRRECMTLCLQDKVNEALFDWFDRGTPIPDVSGLPEPMHKNFI